jgi:Stage II sporulation protein E (SpoIIE)
MMHTIIRRSFSLRTKSLSLLALFLLVSFSLVAEPPSTAAPLAISGLGQAIAPLDGAWQFRTGDDPSWSSPTLDDSTWESITTDKSWGAQQHFNYTGYAWYRRHITIDASTDPNLDLSLYIRHIDDVYELYWNGKPIGGLGKFPPSPTWYWAPAPQVRTLGKAQSGVLAIRVWKEVPTSFDSGTLGGPVAPLLIGTTAAINSFSDQRNYIWLQSRIYLGALNTLYGLVGTLGFLAWFTNRNRKVLFWMAAFAFTPLALQLLSGFRIPITYMLSLSLQQPFFALQDIALWFLLLYLLELDDNPRLVRWTRIVASISFAAACFDALLGFIDPSGPLGSASQWADGASTVVTTSVELFALVLIPFAFKKRHNIATWLVAFFAFLTEMISVVRVASQQGRRFTHWTIDQKILAPLFTIHHNPFTLQLLSWTFLFFSIVYAVYRYSVDESQRQSAIDQEFRSAQELQRVLIPETLPPIAGFAITSAYRPAQEVGGDFFQLIAKSEGSSLFILGDVSGKGLKAAMTVSLIVGTVRTLAEMFEDPAEILSGLNRRLHNRLQQGFVTCLIMRLDPDGTCTFANAGHLPPFLNQQELDVPPALPLGLVASASYDETTITLNIGDRLTLYTDGLLEARNASGEIFSFERLHELLATKPDSKQATDAAVAFGQEDDITVLTITRLATGVESTTFLEAPTLIPTIA